MIAHHRLIVLVSLALVLMLGASTSTRVLALPNAPTFTVNTTADGTSPGACANNVSGGCSLREAVIEANHFPGANVTINIPSGTYTLTILPSGTDDETTGDLNIGASMTIVGAGAATTIIDANQIDRAVNVYPLSVVGTISGVTLRNGKASDGGAIFNSGTLTVNNSVIANNTSTIDGGGIYSGYPLTVNNTTVTNNSAAGNGGGIWIVDNTFTLTNSVVDHNVAAGVGGGIGNDGTVTTLLNSTISNNSATRDGGGVYVSNSGASLSADYTTIAGNLADNAASGTYHGGGLANPIGTASFKDSLLGENYAGINPDDCMGTFSVPGYDIVEYQPLTCVLNLSGTGRLVAPITVDSLANNGGPTATRALLASSAAVGLIPAGTDGCGTTVKADQRGFPRPTGSACAAGAYEGSMPNTLYGVNLIRNADGEGSAGSPTAAQVGFPYWSGAAAIVPYGAAGGFPTAGQVNPPANVGANFFAGGLAPNTTITQTRDLTSIATAVDAGKVKYNLSGYFGGYADQDDYAVLYLNFLDSSGTLILPGVTVGQLSAANRGNNTVLLGPPGCTKCSATGVVPKNTRSILVALSTVRVSAVGPYDDGYADNLSLVLPGPAELFMPLILR